MVEPELSSLKSELALEQGGIVEASKCSRCGKGEVSVAVKLPLSRNYQMNYTK